MSREMRRLGTLYRLTRLLAVGMQDSSLLRTILKEALRLTGGRGAQVLLLKPDRKTLLAYVDAGDRLIDGEEIPADDYPWADVIRAGKVARLRSRPAAADPQAEAHDVTLGIPLLARGGVLGILTLGELSEAWAKPDREPFLETLADMAAHALHNSTLDRDRLRRKPPLPP